MTQTTTYQDLRPDDQIWLNCQVIKIELLGIDNERCLVHVRNLDTDDEFKENHSSDATVWVVNR